MEAAQARYRERYVQILNWDQDRANIVNVFLSETPTSPPDKPLLKLSFDRGPRNFPKRTHKKTA